MAWGLIGAGIPAGAIGCTDNDAGRFHRIKSSRILTIARKPFCKPHGKQRREREDNPKENRTGERRDGQELRAFAASESTATFS
jgi:hypothetical protein